MGSRLSRRRAIAEATASTILNTVLDECAAIHTSVYETFVAYSLEMRLPA